MALSELQSFHPVESKDVGDWPARLITMVVIGLVGILSLVPFAIYFS